MMNTRDPAPGGAVVLNVLVVTDGRPPSVEVADGLSTEGCSIASCSIARAPEVMATSLELDAVVVDLCVPDVDVAALVVTAEVDAARAPIPTVVLTPRMGSRSRLNRLPAGLHDFVLEPVDPTEVVLRVNVLARRIRQDTGTRTLVLGDLVLNEDLRIVYRAGRTVNLTPTEFKLLHYLMSHPRRALSKAELLTEVWRLDSTGDRHNVVELFISYLRKKLHGDLGEPLIHTVRGVGYVLHPLPDKAPT